MVVIVAKNYPSSPGALKVRNALLLTHNADKLRMTPQATLGALLSLCGALIRLACYHWMGNNFTFDVAIRKHHKLITKGPYGVVRHPAYTGGLVVLMRSLMFHTSPGSFLKESELMNMGLGRISIGLLTIMVMIPLLLLRDRMQREDAALRSEFGKDWDEWVRRVPHWLLPGIY
jgi:protein-S-isoprenylcysteine O-methyltransferase Ste14